jgi:protease-4
MRRRIWRAAGITALVFAACFIVILGLLVFGDPSGLARGGSRIAVVEVEGMILDAERVVRELDEHAEDPSVGAIVVRIQSPGGVVAPTQEIYDAITRIRGRDKVVVASMGAVAASGGYYLATAADRILANPGTLTGSIGVIMQLAEVGGLLQKVGVRYEVIKAGKYKDTGNFARAMSPEERAILQELLDDVYEQFVEAVARGRKLPPATVRGLADGRIYSGRRAKELRLVDDLGGLDEAVRVAGELAGIPGKPRVVRARRNLRLADLLDWLGSRTPLGLVLGGGGGAVPAGGLFGTAKLPLYLMD